jgi:hypothetical protein
VQPCNQHCHPPRAILSLPPPPLHSSPLLCPAAPRVRFGCAAAPQLRVNDVTWPSTRGRASCSTIGSWRRLLQPRLRSPLPCSRRSCAPPKPSNPQALNPKP